MALTIHYKDLLKSPMYSNAWHNTLCIAAVSVSLTEKQTINIKSHPNLVISLPENMDCILRKVEKKQKTQP